MKSESTRTLKILLIVGAVLYLLFVALTIFIDSYPIFKPFGLEEILLLIFIAGFVLAWADKNKAAGIILMIWNAGIWILDLYVIREEDYSMLSAVASSYMILGAFFLREWYKTSKATVPSEPQQLKFILRVLLINYAVLYSIVVLSELFAGEGVNFFSFPFIIFPLLLLIFVVGFLLSWKREIIAGYIFLVWCAILIFGTFAYSEIMRLGPWIVFGIPILLQGVFYLENHKKFNPL